MICLGVGFVCACMHPCECVHMCIYTAECPLGFLDLSVTAFGKFLAITLNVSSVLLPLSLPFRILITHFGMVPQFGYSLLSFLSFFLSEFQLGTIY